MAATPIISRRASAWLASPIYRLPPSTRQALLLVTPTNLTALTGRLGRVGTTRLGQRAFGDALDDHDLANLTRSMARIEARTPSP
jgi:hypothetical protein